VKTLEILQICDKKYQTVLGFEDGAIHFGADRQQAIPSPESWAVCMLAFQGDLEKT